MQNRLWLDTHWPEDVREPRLTFGIATRELPMPSCVIPGNLTLGKVSEFIPTIPHDAVAMGYGTFWVIWFDGKSALKQITDMHGGCYQRRYGEWILLGAS